MASAAFSPPGKVKAGLTPGPSSSTSISPLAIASTSAATSAYGVTLPYAESGPKRTVLPTFPAATFRRLTAAKVAVAFEPIVAIPPPMARPGLARANVSAVCLMAATGTPLSLDTALTFISSTMAPKRGSVRPSSTMTLRMASASRPSVPGALRIHWSAFDAVRDCRGSTWITVPARPSRKLCMRVKPRMALTPSSHVSDQSAPKLRMTSASSKA